MKINELADRLHITARAIRFYEEKGLIQPSKNSENGYRTFTEQDAWRLQTIIALKEIGIGLADIRRLLCVIDQGDNFSVRHYLELQRMAMFSQWVEQKQVLSAIDELTSRIDQDTPLCLENLFQLIDGLRRIRLASTSWQDSWGYDHLAASFDPTDATQTAIGFFTSHMEYQTALDFTVQWLSPHPNEVGLDIGAGTGNLSGKLLPTGTTIFAVEQSHEMLLRYREKFPLVTVKLGNFLAIPFFEQPFHFIASSFAFHHLTAEQQLLALEEMNRVLKPNGRICITGLMFENEQTRKLRMNQLEIEGKIGTLKELSKHHLSIRDELISWFVLHNFITIQQQLTEWLHMVYAVRKE